MVEGLCQRVWGQRASASPIKTLITAFFESQGRGWRQSDDARRSQMMHVRLFLKILIVSLVCTLPLNNCLPLICYVLDF